MDNLKLINLTLLSRFKDKIDVLLEKKVNKTDIATTEQLGLIKPDNSTVFVDENGVLSSVSSSGGSSVSSVNYSTEEQVVGTWIDGKPLYQKTIIVEGVSGTNGSFPTTLDDTCEIISYRGVVKIDSSYVSINTDWDNSYRANIYAPTISNFNWSLGSWGGVSNAIFKLIVEYTKTTDTV